MVWSAADPTVQVGYKGCTEEACNGAIHAGIDLGKTTNRRSNLRSLF
jgi:hypothetical protein